MRAIRLHQFGPPENLRLEDVDEPVAGDGQLRVVVEAAGVHVVDTRLRAGEAGGPFAPPELPSIPGREVAGRLESGERVVVHLGRAPHAGGYAEVGVADASSVHRLPEHVDAAEAVAMIGTGRTALLVLDEAQVTADDVVLVPG